MRSLEPGDDFRQVESCHGLVICHDKDRFGQPLIIENKRKLLKQNSFCETLKSIARPTI